MRISDWSSDVCSSDLREIGALVGQHQFRLELPAVGQHHLALAGALDDVLVGDDEALPRDDDAGAARRLLALAALAIAAAVAEAAAEEGLVQQRRDVPPPALPLGAKYHPRPHPPLPPR